MNIRSFIFRDDFEVKAGYDVIVNVMSGKLKVNYFKGSIGRDETKLFYYSGAWHSPLTARLPMIRVSFENKPTSNGKIVVRFKIVDVALILFGLCIVWIWVAPVLGVIRPGDSPFLIPAVATGLSYVFLLVKYFIDRSRFKEEIRRIERQMEWY